MLWKGGVGLVEGGVGVAHGEAEGEAVVPGSFFTWT